MFRLADVGVSEKFPRRFDVGFLENIRAEIVP